MNELFLYDRDKGLFKSILNESTVMQGRYQVLVSGAELNAQNFGAYLSEYLEGQKGVDQKYPVCLCLPPRSIPEEKELFFFTLFFLTRDKHTGQNQLKTINNSQQVSMHHSWYDWKDMAECAKNFLNVLGDIIRKRSTEEGKLSSYFSLLPDGKDLTRISLMGNDKVSGVRVSFRISMGADCEISDYEAPGEIVIPDFNIHPLHKH